MSFLRNPFVCTAILMILALSACAPKSEEPAESPEAATETAAAAPEEVAPIREGSEPKDSGEPAPFAGAETELAKAEGAAEEAIDQSISSSEPYDDGGMLEGLAPAGWKLSAPIEHYNVATLYNKINGRSELYMAYDVRGLGWVSFVSEESQDDFLDLFVYDMRTPTDAFGIFSVEREPDQPSAGLGRLSYRTGSNYYFWKGKYYGYVNASRENEQNTKTGLGILTALMQRIDDSGEPVAGIDLFPKEGLIEDTIQYFKVDAMSLDFLNNTWAGMYTGGDQKARGFISKRASEEEAAGILASFGEYGESYAESVSTATIEGVEVTLADWGGGFYDAAFHVGPEFAGLSNVEGRELLDTAAASLITQIKSRN